jgi:putative ABC transport system ATP-binding protein
MSLIELESVSKTFRRGEQDICALRDISLTVEAGEFLAVLGPSGSGKTTLIGLMGALEKPTLGVVKIMEKDTGTMADAELAAMRNRTVGFVFQNFHLINHFNALENVMLPLFYGQETRPRAREKALAMLAGTGLSDRVHHKPGQLSGGEQQRVAISRAMIAEPAILLCDEPTGNLDSKSGEQVLDLFEKFNLQNKTAVIMVTHNEKAAARAKRKISLVDGIISG